MIHNKYVKWNQDLGQEITDSIWNFGKLHTSFYRTTNVAKYRSFQYRLLQRGIVTNIQLSKWGILPSDLCTYCKLERESLIHLFCLCPKVLELWQQVSLYLQECYGYEDIEIIPKKIIINEITSTRKGPGDLICIITKQFIYKQRCLGQELHFSILKKDIESIRRIEKYIAQKNDRMSVHQTKWNCNIQQSSRPSLNIDDYIESYIAQI